MRQRKAAWFRNAFLSPYNTRHGPHPAIETAVEHYQGLGLRFATTTYRGPWPFFSEA